MNTIIKNMDIGKIFEDTIVENIIFKVNKQQTSNSIVKSIIIAEVKYNKRKKHVIYYHNGFLKKGWDIMIYRQPISRLLLIII